MRRRRARRTRTPLSVMAGLVQYKALTTGQPTVTRHAIAFLRPRVPDAAQRFFSGAQQSRDPPAPNRTMGPGSAAHHTGRCGARHRARIRATRWHHRGCCAASGAGQAVPRRASPESCKNNVPSKRKRAQGMPDAWCTRSLACEWKEHTSVVTTGTSKRSGIPCTMVLTVSCALSPVSMTFQSPSSARCKASSPT